MTDREDDLPGDRAAQEGAETIRKTLRDLILGIGAGKPQQELETILTGGIAEIAESIELGSVRDATKEVGSESQEVQTMVKTMMAEVRETGLKDARTLVESLRWEGMDGIDREETLRYGMEAFETFFKSHWYSLKTEKEDLLGQWSRENPDFREHREMVAKVAENAEKRADETERLAREGTESYLE